MKASSRLKAVFFDIDDTLFSTTAFAKNARTNSVRRMIKTGLKMPVEEVVQELNEVIHEFSSNYDRHFDQLLKRIPDKAYEGINPAFLVASGVIGYHQTKLNELKPFPDAVKALRTLNKTPLLLGVITAGLTVKQAEKLLRLDLYRYFHPHAIFISEQIGISKPNQKLFQKACGTMSLSPSEPMYVGDDPVNDIYPANAAGMITVRIRKESKRSRLTGETPPDYEITHYRKLLTILKNDFAIHADS